MLNVTVMLLLPDVYGSIGTIDQTFGAVNRIQIFAEKNVHGPKIFSVCINQALFIFQEKSIAMKQLLF